MANDQVKTAEDVFETLSTYMNKEHVDFVKKAYEFSRACTSRTIPKFW